MSTKIPYCSLLDNAAPTICVGEAKINNVQFYVHAYCFPIPKFVLENEGISSPFIDNLSSNALDLNLSEVVHLV